MYLNAFHCVKGACIQSFSGPYFPTLGLNTEEYWIRSISPYPIQMQKNTDQKNSKYGHFSISVF